MISDDTLARVIAVTEGFRSDGSPELSGFSGETAVCQDAMIYGIDVEDYVWLLEEQFGGIVRQIPWLRFTDQTFSFRGCGVLIVPAALLWRFVRWPFAGGPILPRPDPAKHPERLTLEHVAAVIDRGEWFEP